MTIVMVVVLVFTSQNNLAKASFKSCFGECEVGCLDVEAKIECTTKCLLKCLILKITQPDSLRYCNFGCSIHRCAKFGDDVEKVDRCVHRCKKITCNLLH
ncbi:PREDICTED: protein TAP1 [Nicotiana attenuata]|nr:PREDICTED: protein TAP1 [Nicotiana attenuata]